MKIDPIQLATLIGIGLVAGFVAKLIVPGGHGGLLWLGYIIPGVLGAVIGPLILEKLKIRMNIGNYWVQQLLVATIGAILVLLVAKLALGLY